jgi:hypothetical protein
VSYVVPKAILPEDGAQGFSRLDVAVPDRHRERNGAV